VAVVQLRLTSDPIASPPAAGVSSARAHDRVATGKLPSVDRINAIYPATRSRSTHFVIGAVMDLARRMNDLRLL
jgi:hypothetical protein